MAVVLLIIIITAAVSGVLLYRFRTGSFPAYSPPNNANDASAVYSASTSTPQNSRAGTSGYSIEVTKVALNELTSGTNGYILNVDAYYSGLGTWNVDPSVFELVSDTSAVYGVANVEGLNDWLPDVVLANGQHAVGQLAFQLPSGQTPSQLEYLNQTANINASTNGIPQVSSYVCDSPNVQVSNSPSSVSGSNVYLPFDIYAINSYYLTGDSIDVNITASYSPEYYTPNPQSMEIASISTNSSVSLTSVQPSLPTALVSEGSGGLIQLQSQTLSIEVATPQEACIRNLDLMATVVPVVTGVTSAQVAVTGAVLPARDFSAAGTTTNFECATASTNAYVSLSNTGSAGATVTAVSITWAGASNAFTPSASCVVSAAGSATSTTYIIFPDTSKLTVSAVAGQTFQGTVTLSNGAQLLFTGTFQ